MLEYLIFLTSVILTSATIFKLPLGNKVEDLGHRYIARNESLPYYLLQQVLTISPILIASILDLRKLLYRLGIHYTLRLPAVWLTSLPSLETRFKELNKQVKGLFGGNTDYIWSGHTGASTIAWMIILKEYNYSECLVLSALCYQLHLGYMILALRNHYSVDVYLGAVIAWLISKSF